MNLFIFLSQMGSNHHFRNYKDISIWKDHHDQYEFKHSISGPTGTDGGLFEWKFDYHYDDFNNLIDKGDFSNISLAHSTVSFSSSLYGTTLFTSPQS